MYIKEYKNISMQKGFTLIEIMVVIVIIAVLAGIALPLYTKAAEKSRITEAVRILGAIRDAEMRYALQYQNYSPGYGSHKAGDTVRAETIGDLDITLQTANKYFSFWTLGANGYHTYCYDVDDADPLNDIDEIIAYAVRNGLDSGFYKCDRMGTPGCSIPDTSPYYDIMITENGTLGSVRSSAVNDLLGGSKFTNFRIF